MMASSAYRRDDARSLIALPSFLLVMLSLLSLTPVPFGASAAMPSFGLIAVFFWGLLRPDLLPAWVLFLAGVMLDALLGLPLGIHALLFLVMRAAQGKAAKWFARRSVWVYWGGFMLFSLGFWLAYWLALQQAFDRALPAGHALQQWIVTGLAYPLLHMAFIRVLAILPARR